MYRPRPPHILLLLPLALILEPINRRRRRHALHPHREYHTSIPAPTYPPNTRLRSMPLGLHIHIYHPALRPALTLKPRPRLPPCPHADIPIIILARLPLARAIKATRALRRSREPSLISADSLSLFRWFSFGSRGNGG
ncbi:hypothetical protein BDZ94DRAFT_1269372 [Collybia nuda]|uniref:Uncharacterized protein n=1 Tax=Collybia nuda TaxID=64659 RepID=A0A9P5XWR6_9AGAR|nr:hypothetical protein BDZ94DRAFT_1269372 [Collybia nuda]